jgi:hypothetical protein
MERSLEKKKGGGNRQREKIKTGREKNITRKKVNRYSCASVGGFVGSVF